MPINRLRQLVLALNVEDDVVNDQTEMWWSKLKKQKPVATSDPDYAIVPASRSTPPTRALFLTYQDTPIGYLLLDNVGRVFDNTPKDLWAPHSFIAKAHRGKGLITSLYLWALNSGVCLITAGQQTSAAYALWTKLSRSYPRYWVDFEEETITKTLSDYIKSLDGTEMLLIGRGRNVSEFTFKG